MSNLGPTRRKDTYKYLIQLPGNIASLVQAETGAGVPLAISISQTGVKILGLLDLGSGTVTGLDGSAITTGTVNPARLPKYTHNQSVPSATWTITHNLNFHPSVTVVDSGGTTVYGNVTYVDSNSIVVVFTSGFAGIAYLN